MLQKIHLCVCICTYKRPEMLEKLLLKLENQDTGDVFDYSILVVDNDKHESARQTVENYSRSLGDGIRYFVEPRQNIALARNKALDNAIGNYIAFIDDDEFPSKTWLLNLYRAFQTYKPNGGVLGPVIPFYPEGTPIWLIKSKICERPNHPSGTNLTWNMTRTGNALLSRMIFHNKRYAFDERKGRSGGEDKAFFKELMIEGYSFCWCCDAVVYETISRDRWKLSFYLRRSLMMGGYTGEKTGRTVAWVFGKSFVSLMCYLVLLIISLFRGKHYLYKTLIRVSYDVSRVMGCLGIIFVKERSEQV